MSCGENTLSLEGRSERTNNILLEKAKNPSTDVGFSVEGEKELSCQEQKTEELNERRCVGVKVHIIGLTHAEAAGR